MGKNTKPMLTVLVEGDKLQQFRDYALSKEVSMGWVVNRLLDRLLSGELDVMGDTPSIGAARENIESVSTGLTREDVESMVKSSIDNQLVDSNRDYIEELVKSSIVSTDIELLVESYIDTHNSSVVSIENSISKLKTYTQSQFAAVRDELRAINDRSVVPTTDAGESKTFAQLAKQLGYEIPDGVKVTAPRKEGADDLIAFATSLGQTYGWDGKKQKFYRTDAN